VSKNFGAKALRASYPDKNWSLSMLQTICCRVDETGSAVTRHAGSGRLKSCVAATGEHFEHCLNTEWAADIHHGNI